MSTKLVTSKQTDSVKDMANAKGVGRANFQNALDDGRVASFLDSLKTVTFGKLTAICIHKEGEEWLPGDEYLRRGREKSGGRATQEAFDFYSKPENWNLLPDDVDVIVFPDSEFDSGDFHDVRCLCRSGAEWDPSYNWVGLRFDRRNRVAVLAS